MEQIQVVFFDTESLTLVELISFLKFWCRKWSLFRQKVSYEPAKNGKEKFRCRCYVSPKRLSMFLQNIAPIRTSLFCEEISIGAFDRYFPDTKHINMTDYEFVQEDDGPATIETHEFNAWQQHIITDIETHVGHFDPIFVNVVIVDKEHRRALDSLRSYICNYTLQGHWYSLNEYDVDLFMEEYILENPPQPSYMFGVDSDILRDTLFKKLIDLRSGVTNFRVRPKVWVFTDDYTRDDLPSGCEELIRVYIIDDSNKLYKVSMH